VRITVPVEGSEWRIVAAIKAVIKNAGNVFMMF
jgi:hypothetical protein